MSNVECSVVMLNDRNVEASFTFTICFALVPMSHPKKSGAQHVPRNRGAVDANRRSGSSRSATSSSKSDRAKEFDREGWPAAERAGGREIRSRFRQAARQSARIASRSVHRTQSRRRSLARPYAPGKPALQRRPPILRRRRRSRIAAGGRFMLQKEVATGWGDPGDRKQQKKKKAYG